MEGFSFLPRGIHSSSTNRQITSYQNHHHTPMINNDVSVDNFNVSNVNTSDIQNASNNSGSSIHRPERNESNCIRAQLASSIPSSSAASVQQPTFSSNDDFFHGQLIAISDTAMSNDTQNGSNDGNSQATNEEQGMELLRPTQLSNQRY